MRRVVPWGVCWVSSQSRWGCTLKNLAGLSLMSVRSQPNPRLYLSSLRWPLYGNTPLWAPRFLSYRLRILPSTSFSHYSQYFCSMRYRKCCLTMYCTHVLSVLCWRHWRKLRRTSETGGKALCFLTTTLRQVIKPPHYKCSPEVSHILSSREKSSQRSHRAAPRSELLGQTSCTLRLPTFSLQNLATQWTISLGLPGQEGAHSTSAIPLVLQGLLTQASGRFSKRSLSSASLCPEPRSWASSTSLSLCVRHTALDLWHGAINTLSQGNQTLVFSSRKPCQ